MGRVFGAVCAIAFAVAGCSAAPEDASSNSDALRGTGGNLGGRLGGAVSVGTSEPPQCPADVSTYWYGYVTLPASVCVTRNASIMSTRPLDRTDPFESVLASAGCNTTVSVLTGHWNITSCPDTCAIRATAASWATTSPVWAQTTHDSPGTCFAANPTDVWVIWDPNCPSTCLAASAG